MSVQCGRATNPAVRPDARATRIIGGPLLQTARRSQLPKPLVLPWIIERNECASPARPLHNSRKTRVQYNGFVLVAELIFRNGAKWFRIEYGDRSEKLAAT